jgi:hypothetical protein
MASIEARRRRSSRPMPPLLTIGLPIRLFVDFKRLNCLITVEAAL